MARTIDKDDGYVERLLKHVPTEIIGAYLAVSGVLTTLEEPVRSVTGWVVFGLFLAATPLWMVYVARVSTVWQNVMSAIAFVVWVMTIPGGPFFSLVPPAIASASVMVFSAVIAPVVGGLFSSKDTTPVLPRAVRG